MPHQPTHNPKPWHPHGTCFIITLGLLTLGCKPTEKGIVGTYKESKHFEDRCKLTLTDKNEFQFEGQEGNIIIEGQGRWILIGDTLVLNSFENTKRPSIEFRTDSSRDNIRVKVTDEKNEPIQGVTISLSKKDLLDEQRTDENVRTSFGNNKYDSIAAGLIGFLKIKSKIPTDKLNDFLITLVKDEESLYRLEDQKFLVKGRTLTTESFPTDKRKHVLRK